MGPSSGRSPNHPVELDDTASRGEGIADNPRALKRSRQACDVCRYASFQPVDFAPSSSDHDYLVAVRQGVLETDHNATFVANQARNALGRQKTWTIISRARAKL